MPQRNGASSNQNNRSSSAVNPSDTSGERSSASVPSAQQPFKGLAIVATPIGHSRDITLRALDIIGQADTIACEDTRVTAKLLSLHGLSRPLVAYHEHNAEKMRPALIKRLKQGQTVALVSDAGTPMISDPGYKLVRACLDGDIPVVPIPGASSVLAALVVSGLPTDRFFFAGFLPSKTVARKKALGELVDIPGSLVFLESARRLAGSLADMAGVLGPRQGVVARELTKKFEELRHGPLPELTEHYRTQGPPKGEVTIVIGPPSEDIIDDRDIDQRLEDALKDCSVRDAADIVAAATGLPRRKIYARALELKQSGNDSAQ
ncbi:MAG: 16S rRNA (cytidine(1402)-2'-O)-methyltransferase [Alphaproteobacteria bacterium]|nr:16S rRNA (cytidine(1402)-2'-O)-methyltransferase [Alphaproteobacteria bacterium]